MTPDGRTVLLLAVPPNDAVPLAESEPGLRAAWRMDESSWTGVGTEVSDLLGGCHGAAYGATITIPGLFSRAGRLDGRDHRVVVACPGGLDTGAALTWEGWVRAASPRGAPAVEQVAERWGSADVLEDSRVTATDLGSLSLPTATSGVVTDGRYVYLAPDAHGTALRLDTWRDPNFPTAWESHNLVAASGTDTGGFRGVVMLSSYVFFLPGGNTDANQGLLLARHDMRSPFNSASAWQTVDLATMVVGEASRYDGAVSDGRYLYLVPADPEGTARAPFIRVDVAGSLHAGSSYAVQDAAATISGGASAGYTGGSFDGRYVYFAPSTSGAAPHGRLLRYDTTGDFHEPSSWSGVAVGAISDYAVGFGGAVFDGRFLYLVPSLQPAPHGNVARLDTTGDLAMPASWTFFNTSVLRQDAVGFSSAVFDGQFIYLVPLHAGGAREGRLLTRYDTTAPFESASSWDTTDLSDSCHRCGGFSGATHDGINLHLAPAGRSDANAVLLRVDTVAPDAAWSVRRAMVGVPGVGLGGDGVTVLARTQDGPRGVTTMARLGSAWHHVALRHDGWDLAAWLDGSQVGERPHLGVLADTSRPLVLGGGWRGDLDEVSLWDVAQSGDTLGEHHRRGRSTDGSGRGHHGENRGVLAATFTDPRVGNAYALSAVTDSVVVEGVSELDLSQRFTVEALAAPRSSARLSPLEPLVRKGGNRGPLAAADVAVADPRAGLLAGRGFWGGALANGRVYLAPSQDNVGMAHGHVARLDNSGAWDLPGSWSVRQSQTVGETDTTGYAGAVTDGRYVYFVPLAGVSGYHGRVLRHDAWQEDINAAGGWAVFDVSALHADARGFASGVFDGRYVYLAPYSHELGAHGRVIRYDSAAPFLETGSWEFFDAATLAGGSGLTTGYLGAVFDGRFVFFAPANSGGTSHGRVLRYDSLLPFTSPSAWSFRSAGADGTERTGFAGAVHDGRYVYFIPWSQADTPHGHVLRHDTRADFQSSSAWAMYDVGAAQGARGFFQGVFDGRYVTLVPGPAPGPRRLVQYDTTQGFTTTAAWSSVLVTQDQTGVTGWPGVVFDGRYLYGAPQRGCPFLRADTAGGRSAWMLAWSLEPSGSAGAALWAPAAMLDTNQGHFVATARGRPSSRWHHLAMTYDGAALRLFLDGQEAASTPAWGTLSGTGTAITVGGGKFYGHVDQVAVWDAALTAADFQARGPVP